VYLFTGKEEFLMDASLGEIKQSLITEGFEDFDYDLGYGGEVAFADILKKLQTPPFGSKKRLVVMKTLKKLPPSERQALADYLQSPNTSTCLVLVAPGEPDSDKFLNPLKKWASIIIFEIEGTQITTAIADRARAKGLALEPGAAELIRELVGDSLLTVDSELEKLKIFLGTESKVSQELIDQVSGDTREYQIKNLSQTIVERNRKRALEILCRLKNWDAEPTWIVNALGWKFFDLLSGKDIAQEPNTDYTPAIISGKKASVASQPNDRSRHWRRTEIINRLRGLKAIDLKIKQGFRDPFYLLESFISQNI